MTKQAVSMDSLSDDTSPSRLELAVKRVGTLYAVALICMLSGCEQPRGTLSLEVTEKPPASLAQFETFRMEFDVRNAQGNPFDPDEVNAYVNITTPAGEQQKHFAFFTRDYEIVIDHGREAVRDLYHEHWELRWTPTQAGTYHWELQVEVNCRVGRESHGQCCFCSRCRVAHGRVGHVDDGTIGCDGILVVQ